MRATLGLAAAALLAAGVFAGGTASAQGIRIVVVSHGQAADPF